MPTIRGSLELITDPQLGPDATSVGLPVAAMDPDSVPMILQQVYGLTEVTAAEPDNGQQVAVWTATNAQLRSVRCVLWREPDIEETLIGQMLAMVTGGDDEP